MPTVTDTNKIEYGLSQAFFAPMTKTTGADGVVKYDYETPIPLIGIQSLTAEPQGKATLSMLMTSRSSPRPQTTATPES